MRKEKLHSLEKTIGYTFKEDKIFIQALTHKSYANENKGVTHNERLEFLGDAVLQYVSTVQLYNLYPEEAEGVLSVYRSTLVKTEYLATVATELNLEEHLRISEGQRREFERNNKSISILADTVEAIIGALYEDGGLEVAEEFIRKHVLVNVDSYLNKTPTRDPKTTYQEYTQRERGITPHYEIIEEHGPAHDKKFTIGLYLDDEHVSTGEGKSKQDAEKAAAEKALKDLDKKK